MIEKIWARALGHYMGKTDDDMPEIPIVSMREARVGLGMVQMELGEVYIVGGFSLSPVDTIEVYKPTGGGWYTSEFLAQTDNVAR